MKHTTIILPLLAFATATLSLPQAASALTITNMDDTPHQVVFETNPGSARVFDIAPGHTVRATGKGRVYLADKPQSYIPVEWVDEVAVWKGGKLGIQFRNKFSGSNR